MTLGDAQTIVMTLKLGKTSKHVFKVVVVEEKVHIQRKQGERLVTVTHFEREDLHPDVQGFCDLLEAGLVSRFAEVPDDLVLLSMVTDFRFSLFTFVKGNDALRHALRSRGSRLLKEAMERAIAKKRSGTTKSSSEEEEEAPAVATQQSRSDMLAVLDSPAKSRRPRSSALEMKQQKKRQKMLASEDVLTAE